MELPEHRLNPRKGKQGNGPRQRAAAHIGPVRSPAPQRHSPESKKVAALPLLPDCRRCRRTGSPSRCCCCGSSPPTDVEGWRIHATARSGSARSGSAPPQIRAPSGEAWQGGVERGLRGRGGRESSGKERRGTAGERIGRRVNEERHDERGQIKIRWRSASLSVWNRIRR